MKAKKLLECTPINHDSSEFRAFVLANFLLPYTRNWFSAHYAARSSAGNR